MKKIALLLLTSLILWNCGDEVEFSTPGFQGKKNYNLWRADYFNATLTEGNLVIKAGVNNEELTFTLPSANATTFLLSDNSAARADFTDFEDIEYSTSNTPDPSVSLYPEIGEIEISESTVGYISGSFRFNAFSEDGLRTIGFHEGVFYRVPIGGGTTTPGTTVSCQEATVNLATASTNFNQVQQGDAEYAARCNAYKTALQQMIAACGDPGGTLQTIFNALGECN